MEHAEVFKRVIGILTEAQEMRRKTEAGENDDRTGEPGVVTQLLNEMMPQISLPPNATVQQTAHIVSTELGPVLQRMIGGFSLAFLTLAAVHDSGQTDVTSTDVLRDLALRIGTGRLDDL